MVVPAERWINTLRVADNIVDRVESLLFDIGESELPFYMMREGIGDSFGPAHPIFLSLAMCSRLLRASMDA